MLKGIDEEILQYLLAVIRNYGYLPWSHPLWISFECAYSEFCFRFMMDVASGPSKKAPWNAVDHEMARIQRRQIEMWALRWKYPSGLPPNIALNWYGYLRMIQKHGVHVERMPPFLLSLT